MSYSIKVVGVDTVKPYEKNARIIPLDAVVKVATSIKEFGWRQPIVVDVNNVIIAGHTRLQAAKHLGLKKVPIHVATELTQDQVDAYRLMDNRSNQESGWDNDLVTEELASLKSAGYDLGLTGFSAAEQATLLADLSADTTADDLAKAKQPERTKSEPDHSDKKSDPANKKMIICPRCRKHFVEA